MMVSNVMLLNEINQRNTNRLPSLDAHACTQRVGAGLRVSATASVAQKENDVGSPCSSGEESVPPSPSSALPPLPPFPSRTLDDELASTSAMPELEVYPPSHAMVAHSRGSHSLDLSARPRHPISAAVGRLFNMEDFDHLGSLGEGFFSVVSKVRVRDSGEVMVLKVSKRAAATGDAEEDRKADVANEYRVMSRLSHRSLLALKGLCVDVSPKGLWDVHLLVDYCAGGSLARLILDRSSPLPWSVRVGYATEVADAMEYLHGKEMIHRDLTSMNVLLRDEGAGRMAAVVADFGLSCPFPKQIEEWDVNTESSASSGEKLAQVGTTYFMSPECLKEQYYDEKSDVFSFGVILCQMIARIEADPDSGLHRTASFGLHYTLFASYCPPDTPLQLLQLAFECCLLDPLSRPSFDVIHSRLLRMRAAWWRVEGGAEEQEDVTTRLARSRSDAALRRPSRGRLSQQTSCKHISTLNEGVAVPHHNLTAVEELAREVAREAQEALGGVMNPFRQHKRFRVERKILPRCAAEVGGRRRSETKTEGVGGARGGGDDDDEEMVDAAAAAMSYAMRRCTSLPSEMDSPVNANGDGGESPGRIPMTFRDQDQNFLKAMKRFPSRRHTVLSGRPAATLPDKDPSISPTLSQTTPTQTTPLSSAETTPQAPPHSPDMEKYNRSKTWPASAEKLDTVARMEYGRQRVCREKCTIL